MNACAQLSAPGNWFCNFRSLNEICATRMAIVFHPPLYNQKGSLKFHKGLLEGCVSMALCNDEYCIIKHNYIMTGKIRDGLWSRQDFGRLI